MTTKRKSKIQSGTEVKIVNGDYAGELAIIMQYRGGWVCVDLIERYDGVFADADHKFYESATMHISDMKILKNQGPNKYRA